MKLTNSQIKAKLLEAGLKITPQRMAILEAVYAHNGHPTADNIIETIKITYPNIATGTVYKILDALVENKIIQKVKTEKDIMRYDGIMEHHHHLYCSDSDRIEDYVDRELNEMLDKYFEKNAIPDFKIEDIKLQIIGKFTNSKQ
jgi:Fur family transcriptional regulator, peroxide stress response regulator